MRRSKLEIVNEKLIKLNGKEERLRAKFEAQINAIDEARNVLLEGKSDILYHRLRKIIKEFAPIIKIKINWQTVEIYELKLDKSFVIVYDDGSRNECTAENLMHYLSGINVAWKPDNLSTEMNKLLNEFREIMIFFNPFPK